jgi:exodeoxyribonuclease VII large subunit
VARAIYGSKVPVVSAVGHEIDFTIADFVADVRAPTPSAAAELVVPDRTELLARVRESLRKLIEAERSLLEQQESRLESLLRSYAFRLTGKKFEEELQALDELGERLRRAIALRLERSQQRLQALIARLEVANPLAVLARGYAIVTELRSGRVLKAAAEAAPGERLKVRLARGELLCRVEEVD